MAARSLALAAVLLAAAGLPAAAQEVSGDHADRLDHLLRHDCGSCHGMTMKGGLGPALLPATLRDRDEDGLVQMILYGNPAKAMPPWGQLLTETEARWIVRRLKRGIDRRGDFQ
jgi:cytochrome c55X